MRKILKLGIIGLFWLSLFSPLSLIDTVYAWSAQGSPYPDPGGKWEAQEARWMDIGWEEVADPDANDGSAMMVNGTTITSQDLRFNWTNRGRPGLINFLVRLKVSDVSGTAIVASLIIFTGVEVDEVGPASEQARRDITTDEFPEANQYVDPQRFMITTHIPADEKVVIVVRYEPDGSGAISLYCDFVIISTDLTGHGRITWNALELLTRDGYGLEANITKSYWIDVQNGLRDADSGSATHGGQYDGVPLIDVDVEGLLIDRALGGFSHYFDPWDHHGLGVAEDWELIVAGTYVPVVDLIVRLVESIIADPFVRENFQSWKDWLGPNAAEGARRSFNRAVQAWQAGDERKAMYLLGYALHCLEDVCVPHHAAHTMLSGHTEFDGVFVSEDMKENLDYYLVDRPGRSSGMQQFSGSTQDHGIYLGDLYSLSDGIYIAGDSNLVDTEACTGGLRYGHVTQLHDPIYQFVDFAAHEAIEWYPLTNSEHDESIDFDNWWEIWNYIETRNDLKMKTVDGERVPFSSSLIFHFEGVDWIQLEFEGSWENLEAIDMENWVCQDLGSVTLYSDYAREQDPLRFTGSLGSLTSGPTVCTPHPTIAVQTEVNRWGGYGDHDCDGWQFWEIEVGDQLGLDEIISDPLLESQPRYRTTAGGLRTLPRLDDPLPEPEPAKRVAAVHTVDLASKLSAGLIKHFFDEVNLPRGGPPQTSLGVIPPEPLVVSPDIYTDEYGRKYARHGTEAGCTGAFTLEATSYRTVWQAGEYVLEPVGYGIKRIHFKIDDEPWAYIEFQLFPGIGPPEATIELPVPIDELPHTIQYYSENYMDQAEPVHTQVVVWDMTAPMIEISVGDPKILVDGSFNVTEETLIYINTLDEGSGAHYTRIGLYLTPYELPGGEWPDAVYTWYRGPEVTFTLNANIIGLPNGHWRIEVGARDYVGNFGITEIPRVDVVEFIEGVDVSIDPHIATVEPGSSIEYTISIRNRYQTTQTYDLTLDGLDPSWCTLPQTSLTIAPDETEEITLTVSPPHVSQMLNVYSFTVTATLQDPSDVSDSADALLDVVYEPELPVSPTGTIAVAVVPDLIGAQAGTKITVDVRVANKQNFDEVVRLEIGVEAMPPQDQADLTWFSWTGQRLFIPEESTLTVPLTIAIPAAGFENYRDFDAIATSTIWTTEARARIIIDATPPTTTLDIGAPQYVDAVGNVFVTSDTALELTAVDNDGEGSGVADTRHRIYNATYDSGWTTSVPPITFQITGLNDGVYNIDYYSTDNAGNVESTHTEPIILDNTPPTITINSPTAEDYLHSETLVIDFDVMDNWSGVASVTAELDGSPVSDGDLIDLLTLTLTTHTLTITTVDNLGHLATATVTFNVVADVDSLIDLVERFNESGQIDDPEVGEGLLDKLYAAQVLIDAGKLGPARNILRAFIRQVEAQLGHHITEEAAAILLADAEYLLEHL